MEDIPPQVSASVVVGGRNWNPDDCTRATGLQPTGTWRQMRDDLRQRQDLVTETWSLGVEDRPLYEIDAVINEAIDLVWDRRDQMVEFVTRQGLECLVYCVVWAEHNRPVYELTPRTMARMCALNATFSLATHGEWR